MGNGGSRVTASQNGGGGVTASQNGGGGRGVTASQNGGSRMTASQNGGSRVTANQNGWGSVASNQSGGGRVKVNQHGLERGTVALNAQFGLSCMSKSGENRNGRRTFIPSLSENSLKGDIPSPPKYLGQGWQSTPLQQSRTKEHPMFPSSVAARGPRIRLAL